MLRNAASIEQNDDKSLKLLPLGYPCKAHLLGPNRLVQSVRQ
jgi:hypothetical protein